MPFLRRQRLEKQHDPPRRRGQSSLQPQTLSELETQARDGNPTAFGALVRRFDHDLRGVAWAVVRSSTETDDVMQTAYERAFLALAGRSGATFDGRASIKTWLHSIVYRTAIDHVRYEGRRKHDDVESLVAVASTASTSDAALDKTELSELFETLETEARVLVMLTAGLGLSYEETAEVVGLPRGTVASRVSRARARLQQQVER